MKLIKKIMRNAAIAAPLAVAVSATADEGMWPYNMVPVETIAKNYGFKPDAKFLDNSMRASVRFNSGGSGSFVSPNGLVMTNHHVGSDCIQKIATKPGSPDYMKEGFIAANLAEEQACPDLELNQLLSIEDVTGKVEAAASALDAPAGDGNKAADVKDDKKADKKKGDKKADKKADKKKAGKDAQPTVDLEAAKNKARKAEMSRIEQECNKATGNRCDVVTLYGGNTYHLYQYKKYTDVRLVMAPEFPIAFFGGDPENFNYPRHDLDVAFFRVYEDGKPAKTNNYFPFSKTGPKEGELAFVSGHPGSTDRFAVVGKLELLRDTTYPFVLKYLGKERSVLVDYMKKGEAQDKAARDDLFGVENSIKALTGYHGGLKDKALMAEAQRRQDTLIEKIKALPDAKDQERLLASFDKLNGAYKTAAGLVAQYYTLERYIGPSGQLIDAARTLLRASDELSKKSEDRLREFRDSNLESLKFSLYSDATIDKGLQIELITLGIENMIEVLGKDDKTVQQLLGKGKKAKTPREIAESVVNGSKLYDAAERKKLFEGGKKAVDAAKDPAIQLVAAYDQAARAIRKEYEDKVESIERTYAGRIAEANGKVYGSAVYPDATFTLRLSYGPVAGYEENGKKISWHTQFGDLYAVAKQKKNEYPYELPKRWQDAKSKLDFTTSYNFVSTADIIGGNSGSPVFNKDGQIIGIIFDGNLSSLPNRFVYSDTTARSVSVDSNAILQSLDKVYGAGHVADELRGKK